MTPTTQLLERSFSKSAMQYDRFAKVQHQVAQQLATFIKKRAKYAGGSILELGCGTGNLTEQLVSICKTGKLVVTDLSPEMLGTCSSKFAAADLDMSFRVLDAQDPASYPAERFALIASSFVLHWLQDRQRNMRKLLDLLDEGGSFYFACPIAGSFHEWQEICSRVGVPCSANELPGYEMLEVGNGFSCESVELDVAQHFDKALEFFQWLKMVGAATRIDGGRLTTSQFRKLLRGWDSSEPVGMTFKILLGEISRQ
jgi:malonyl-CoA O-methyltransferase